MGYVSQLVVIRTIMKYSTSTTKEMAIGFHALIWRIFASVSLNIVRKTGVKIITSRNHVATIKRLDKDLLNW